MSGGTMSGLTAEGLQGQRERAQEDVRNYLEACAAGKVFFLLRRVTFGGKDFLAHEAEGYEFLALHESLEAFERGDESLVVDPKMRTGERLSEIGGPRPWAPGVELVKHDGEPVPATLSVIGYRRVGIALQGGVLLKLLGWPAWCGECSPDRTLLEAWEEYQRGGN